MPADRITVGVVGTGPAGLIAAEVIASHGISVTVIDQMAAPGRKFLLAGRSGLNLTHSEPLDRVIGRYQPSDPRLLGAIERFGPTALRDWCHGLGIETVIGSSGRVFPSCWKASPVLRAWLERLNRLGVTFRMRTELVGVTHHTGEVTQLSVRAVPHRRTEEPPEGEPRSRVEVITFDAVVLALGGGSWPGTGSTGTWVQTLRDAAVPVAGLRTANAGWLVPWSDHFLAHHEGSPLKNVVLRVGDATVRGELTVTRSGLQGTPAYTLSTKLGTGVGQSAALASIDLRPDEPVETIAAKLTLRRRGATVTRWLRALNLSDTAIALVHETLDDAHASARIDPGAMALFLKAVPIGVVGPEPMRRAISTAGGITWDAIDDRYILRQVPSVGVAGEMLDWTAPTGGYLLQGCFSTGVAAAHGVLHRLGFHRLGFHRISATGTGPSWT